jgi:hypothetical protein
LYTYTTLANNMTSDAWSTVMRVDLTATAANVANNTGDTPPANNNNGTPTDDPNDNNVDTPATSMDHNVVTFAMFSLNYNKQPDGTEASPTDVLEFYNNSLRQVCAQHGQAGLFYADAMMKIIKKNKLQKDHRVFAALITSLNIGAPPAGGTGGGEIKKPSVSQINGATHHPVLYLHFQYSSKSSCYLSFQILPLPQHSPPKIRLQGPHPAHHEAMKVASEMLCSFIKAAKLKQSAQ